MELIIKEQNVVLYEIKIEKEAFYNLSFLTNYLKDINNTLKSQILKELKTLNFNYYHLGTTYILECTYIAYLNNKTINFTKEVFPYIIEKYSTNISKIKSNIFYAINHSYYECHESLLSEYFNRNFTSKPLLKDIVYGIIEHIKKTEELS